MAPKIITKAEAIKRGLKTYYTGKPCPKGHIDEIFVRGRCRTCTLEATAARRAKARSGKTITVYARKVPTKNEDRTVTARMVAPNPDWHPYAARITAAWQKMAASIIEVGKILNEAKDKLEFGDFGTMLQTLPFGERTAQMLMAIADNPVLTDTKHVSVLPASWGTLYALTKVPDDVLLARIEDGTINPDMQRKDVALITGARDPQTKLRPRSPKDERIIQQAEEINRLTEHVAELEAARTDAFEDTDVFEETDDPPTAAHKIVLFYGKERLPRLIEELEKLIREEAA